MSREAFHSVDPLFYLSSFQNPFAGNPGTSHGTGVFPMGRGDRKGRPYGKRHRKTGAFVFIPLLR